MTNEELAIQSWNERYPEGNELFRDAQIDGFIAGAECKEKQFKEYLEGLKSKHPMSYRSDWKAYENNIYHEILDEIIDGFFKDA